MINTFDTVLIHFLRKYQYVVGRFSMFTIFFWFGILKIFDSSPANPLVAELLSNTMPFISFQNFIIVLGVYEMIIGILFLIPSHERTAIFLLIPHMITTVMPLILLPTITWVAPFVPTLEGQYIIKNVVIIALAFGLAAHMHPLKNKHG